MNKTSDQTPKKTKCYSTAKNLKELRELLSPQKEWIWMPAHAQAFQNAKDGISSPHVLSHYDLEKPTKKEKQKLGFLSQRTPYAT